MPMRDHMEFEASRRSVDLVEASPTLWTRPPFFEQPYTVPSPHGPGSSWGRERPALLIQSETNFPGPGHWGPGDLQIAAEVAALHHPFAAFPEWMRDPLWCSGWDWDAVLVAAVKTQSDTTR
eukprot:272087-Heterocapsa_arctica.AAC.1